MAINGLPLLLSALLLTTPAVVQAQFIYETNNAAITITGYSGPGGDVVIPGVIEGFAVKTIGDHAFSYNSDVTSVTIGNGVGYIGAAAFANCSNLVSVTIPDSVTNIGHSVFSSCVRLTNATLGQNLTRVSQSAFWGCGSLSAVNIADNVPQHRILRVRPLHEPEQHHDPRQRREH